MAAITTETVYKMVPAAHMTLLYIGNPDAETGHFKQREENTPNACFRNSEGNITVLLFNPMGAVLSDRR